MNIKQKIRNFLRPYIANLDIRLNPKKYRVGNFYCPVCRTNINHFNRLPDENFQLLDDNGFVHSFFALETLNFLNYSCPVCKASDRDRLFALFFERNLPNLESDFLDIAPTKGLSRHLKLYPQLNYRSADLYLEGVDDKVDITDMNIYGDERFDIILCSHVLEHVKEDVKAINEFYRIMKKGGFGIFMVPILLSLTEDYQPEGITSEAERWKHFAQGDHVRMYSKAGFVGKLNRAGFEVKTFGKEYFGEDDFTKCGISQRSLLYVAYKK